MGVVFRADAGLESCRLSDAVFRLFAKGSRPGSWFLIIDASLDVSSSLISGGKSPLAVTMEYCRRFGVSDSSLEVSSDNFKGAVSVPLIGTVKTG